jgi:hypothetical protein
VQRLASNTLFTLCQFPQHAAAVAAAGGGAHMRRLLAECDCEDRTLAKLRLALALLPEAGALAAGGRPQA